MDNLDVENYWDERLRQNYDVQGVGYNTLGIKYNQWLYRVRRNVFLRIANALDVNFENAKVLDIGCGTGFYIDLWQKIGVKRICGIDISEYAVSKLRAKYPRYQFSVFDIGRDDVELVGTHYDCVSAFDVLFHIIEDDKYRFSFNQISSLLKPGGLFLFSENFLHMPQVAAKHQVSRSIDTIVSVMQKSGFSIVDRVPMFYLMNAPIDSKNKLMHFYWRALSRLLNRYESVGQFIGAAIYPIELFLVKMMKESPSTEIMICRKDHRTN